MANMMVVEIPQPKPPVKIMLELDLDEAAVIAKLCGIVGGRSKPRDMSEHIYKQLTNIKAVQERWESYNVSTKHIELTRTF